MHSYYKGKFSVIMIILLDSLRWNLAEGIVLHMPRQNVHNYPIKEGEVVVQVTKVLVKNAVHPIYKYRLERNSFAQWDKNYIMNID